MSGHEEYDDANAEDVGQTGPGAPTPLSQLEVSTECRVPYLTESCLQLRILLTALESRVWVVSQSAIFN